MIILYGRYDYRSVSWENRVKVSIFFLTRRPVYVCVRMCGRTFVYLSGKYERQAREAET